MNQGKPDYQHSYAAVYCRLSKDDEQAGESVSIETQRMMLRDYCREQGFPIFDFYVDDGYSGLNFNRPDFIRMLKDIDGGKINIVITKDLSRLGRDYIQTGYYTDVFFSKKRIRYIALNDGIDTDRDNNDIAPFKNILNDMYAKDLSRKVKSAKRLRACKGYFISGQAPYGYQVDPANRNHLIVDTEAAGIVKEIYRLALAGNSTCQISSIMTSRKVIKPGVYKAKMGDTRFLRYCKTDEDAFRWCCQTIRSILQDQVYTGAIVNHKTEVVNYKTKELVRLPKEQYLIVPNCHEAIVSQDEYDLVQTLIRLRHRPNKHNFNNIFKDLAFCSECGHRMSLMMKPLKSGLTPMLHCTNHFVNPKQCTHNHYIYYDKLYSEILSEIHHMERRIESGELLIQLQKESEETAKQEKHLAEFKKVEKRMTALKKIVRQIYEDYSNDLLDADNFHSLLSDYMREQKQLGSQMDRLKKHLHDIAVPEQNVQKLKNVLNEFIQEGSLSANLLNRLFERIEISHMENCNGKKRQGITIVFRFVGAVEGACIS